MAKTLDTAQREQTLQIGVVRLQSLSGGIGEPVLILHDIDYVNDWQPFEDILAHDFALTVPSHLGFGASELPAGYDSIDDLAYLYLDLLRQTGAQHVVGLGFGGWLAAEMAVRCDDHMRSLTLVDAVGIKVGGVMERDIADTFVLNPREFLQIAWHDAEAGAEVMKLAGLSQLSEADALAVLRNRETAALLSWNPFLHNPKLASRLHRIRVPTLVLWGASDRIVTPDYGRAFAERIPGARFKTIAESGHYPYLETPEAFVAALTGFLQQH
jgi:pimeloyl-ACP methyl ester carboxylesterase